MRRAQLTLFVLIGIIVVAAVSIGIYLTTELAEQEQNQREDDLRDHSQYDQLNQYLRSCLESNIANASSAVFAQGGVLYDDQNGTANRTNTVPYAPFPNNEQYDVKPAVLDEYPCSDATKTPPEYPVANTSFDDYPGYDCWTGSPYPSNLIRNQAGYLGVASFPTSCTFTSSNRVDNLNNDFVGVQCGVTYASTPRYALETHLEDAAEQSLVECASNTSLVSDMGGSITLAGEPNVTVGYAEETTRFQATVPFQATTMDDTTVQRSQFTYEAPVDIVDTWSTIHEALKADVRQPHHNLSEELTGYSVTEEEQGDTTIYKIQDQDTVWGGEPLTVVLAVEQRDPVLDYINQDTSPANLVVRAGNTVSLEPDAIDPDDDHTPNISYDGFGETHPSIDASGRAQPSDPLSAAEHTGLGGTVTPGNAFSDAPSGEHTVSNPYDWGLYTTTVQAENQTGSVGDYQDVTILIVDRPRLNVKATHPTGNTPLSIEAPITVNASQSQPPKAFGQTPLFNVEWRINNSPVTPGINGFNTAELSGATIQNIKTSNEAIGFSTPSTNISLEATANTTHLDNVQNTVRTTPGVQRCRPNNAATGEPYPFNTSNAYTTANPCCEAGPTVVPSSEQKTCYEDSDTAQASTLAARLQAFNESVKAYESPLTTVNYEDINEAYNNLTSSTGTQVLTVERFCGGARGNICGGKVNITVN